MPQMSPMLWSILFIYFIILFIYFNILNYFNFIPSVINKKSISQTTQTMNFLTWKW